MTDAILTPFDLSDATHTGRRRFWKRILPKTEIDYKGQKVNFDDQFHTDLAESFRKGAYDQVPLVFADGNNQHNMDPRNFGGDILDIQHRTDGTYALIEADKEAHKAIQRNPKLGVSARIVQGLQKADGRTFNRAVNHVLLTMNPRVSGLGPWQAVDLSEDADIEVVDLTASDYKEGSPMGTSTKTGDKTKRTLPEIDLSALSDDEFQELLDFTATLAEPGTEEDEDEDEIDPDEVEDLEAETRKRRKKSKTKISIEKESEDDGDDEGDDDDEDETDLSEVATNRSLATQVRQMQIDLAEGRWEGERTAYEVAGVPPFLLDLAEPVLSQPNAMTIDLSDGETVDATATIRKMLDGVKGVMDFTPEIGHQIDLTANQEPEDGAKVLLDAWDEQYG